MSMNMKGRMVIARCLCHEGVNQARGIKEMAGTWIQIFLSQGRTCWGGKGWGGGGWGGVREDGNSKLFLSMKVVNQGDGQDLDTNLVITRKDLWGAEGVKEAGKDILGQ